MMIDLVGRDDVLHPEDFAWLVVLHLLPVSHVDLAHRLAPRLVVHESNAFVDPKRNIVQSLLNLLQALLSVIVPDDEVIEIEVRARHVLGVLEEEEGVQHCFLLVRVGALLIIFEVVRMLPFEIAVLIYDQLDVIVPLFHHCFDLGLAQLGLGRLRVHFLYVQLDYIINCLLRNFFFYIICHFDLDD